MSFTIVTNVFCDFCPQWDSESGGAVGAKENKKEAWKLAKSFGWKKTAFKRHICPSCQKENANDRP